MPEIRQRNPDDFIKSKGKVREHRSKKEEANEYAAGVTEEAITDAAIKARHIPGNVIQQLRPKTKELVLNEPEAEDPQDTNKQQQQQLAVQKAQEQTDSQEAFHCYTDSDPAELQKTEPPLYPQYSESESPAETSQHHNSAFSAESPPQNSTKPDIKEKPRGDTVPKQRPQQEPKTRSHTEQIAHKTNRPTRRAQGVHQSATKKVAEQGRKKFQREAQKKMAKNSKKAAQKTAEISKKVVVAVARAVKSVVETIVAAFGGIGVVAILAVIVVMGVLLASPLGILFSNESTSNSVPLSSAVSQINMELNTRLTSLQSGDYTQIIVEGAPPNWTDVVAVFASYTAGVQTGVDVTRLTPDCVSRLQAVFWQMCYITSSTETVTIPDSDPHDNIDDSRMETTLTITITGKTAEEMRTIYGFTSFQNETLDFLLSDTAMLNELIGNMNINQQDAQELLRSLPSDLSPERRAVVQHALSLVGKVNYFWGGKSHVMGWDSRWGQLREVASAGSPTTGTYRPFGLDCSGFADWVFYNTSGGEYILGHGGGAAAQHRYCEQISWGEAKPGDLVFYPDDSHVGIVGLRDVTGNLLIVHCSSSQNNVVITDSSGFMTVGRPLYYSE